MVVSDSPPIAIRGGEITDTAIHWYSSTWDGWGVEQVKGWVLGAVGLAEHEMDGADTYAGWHGMGSNRFYHYCLVGPYGSRIHYSYDRDDIHVELPGTYCEAAAERILWLMRLDNVQATRIDLAADFEGGPSPATVYGWLKNGQSLLRGYSQKKNIRCRESLEGDSMLTVGSRTSQRYLRVYDKRGFNRWEIEVKFEAAEALRAMLGGLEEDMDYFSESFSALVLGAVSGFVEFVQPAEDSNISRAEVQPWFEQMFGFVQQVKVFVKKESNKLEKRVERAIRNVAVLAAAALEAGLNFHRQLGDAIYSGRQKLHEQGRYKPLLNEVIALQAAAG